MALGLTRFKIFFRELCCSCGSAFAVSVATGLVVSLTEGAGIFLLGPLLGLMGVSGGIVVPGFPALPFTPTLETLLALYAAIISVRCAFAWFSAAWNLKLEHDFLHGLRVRVLSSATGMEWSAWTRQNSSHFLNAVTAETERVGEAMHAFLSMLNSILLAAVYAALAFCISRNLTLLALGASFLLFFLMKGASRRVAEDGHHISTANDDFFRIARERLQGLKWIRQNGEEARAVEEAARASDRLRAANIRAGQRFAYLRGFLEIAAAAGLAFLAYFAIAVLKLTLSSVLLCLVVFARVLPRVTAIQQDYHEWAGRLPSFSNVYSKIRHVPVASDIAAPIFSSELRMERVAFAHAGGETFVFEDASLSVPKRSLTVVTGPSGSGKTTLADLASGLLFPESGSVTVDGEPLTLANAAAWRDEIAVLTQEAFLFDDTVRANLLWMVPHAADVDLKEALEKAGAWEFVQALPQKMDTRIGENGVRLSGGERQRLALARAILKKPTLFILDEPTSALGPEAADLIANTLEKLAGEAAVLCFMHRLPRAWEARARYEIKQYQLTYRGYKSNLSKFMLT